MKGNQMRRNHLLKYTAVLFLAGGLFAAMPRRIVYSVRDKGLEIITRLREGPQTLPGLYAGCRTGSEIVATFVAVLELCRSGNLQFERVEGQVVLQFTGTDKEIETILENFEEES